MYIIQCDPLRNRPTPQVLAVVLSESITLSLVTDITDVTLRASGIWVETRTGAAGTATLA